MAEETRTGPQQLVPANDSGDLVSPEGGPENVATAKLDRLVLDIARLIGGRVGAGSIRGRVGGQRQSVGPLLVGWQTC
ncbi:hypothetical protein [Mesorhizobium abyssinicae]|uniref:hypothetical protein n=1 Tax=Mesorhizobium abyssinicae TaxID=1209958 RepID=UPI003392D4BC